MAEDGYKIVEDWLDYDKSLISTLAETYYKAQGIKAYSNSIVKFIPNDVTNCFPHAASIAQMLQKILEHKEQITVLDLGCGAGLFSRHLLIALKELGINNKVKLILADYSKKVLEDIKSLKILAGFDNYELVEMNALDPKSAKDLKGKAFKLPELDFIVMNYLYDALPTKVLRPKEDSYEKLQFSFYSEDQNDIKITTELVCQDLNLINKLLIDTRWENYDPEQESESEKEYFEYLKNEPANPIGEVIYNYGALQVTQTFLDLLSEDGILYATDMPNRFDSKSSFTIYGNAAAHNINESLMINTFVKKGYEVFFQRDFLLNHYFYAKTQSAIVRQEKPINENFVKSSKTDLFVDHKQAINAINSAYSRDLFRMIVKELIKMDIHSCFSKVAQAQDLLNFEEREKAKAMFEEAQKVDFLGDFNLKARLDAIS